MRKLSLLLLVVLVFVSLPAKAVDLTITREELLTVAGPFFPYPVSLGTSTVLLSKPDLALLPNEQAIILKVLMDVSSANEKMQLAGKIKGRVAFDASSQQIHLVKPTVEALDIISGQATSTKQTLDMIQQNIGQEMPIILLFDVKSLTGGVALFNIQNIRITQRGLLVSI